MASDTPLDSIRRGAVQIITEADLRTKLKAPRPLIVKAGFDPTAPDLHLGHTVLLRKLRHFQDLGHKVIFLIGDATALVGDPSGQTQTRKLLSWEDVSANAKTYLDQVQKILLTHRQVFEVRHNSEWFLGRSPQRRTEGLETFDFTKWVHLASRYTVARLIERDDFAKRLKAGKPLSMLELFYPLLQGYDSVKIAEQYGSCDLELGGTDQTFNLLVGRELLREYGFDPQVVLTLPLLEGTDGVSKMSKSLGNHVGIQDPPNEMFGKLMSIPDELIVKYFTLLTDVETAVLKRLERDLKAKQINPRDAKADLAEHVVALYHGSEAAKRARSEFAQVFSKRGQPSEIQEAVIEPDGIVLVDVLVSAHLAKTKNEARRLIRQGAVKLNGKVIRDPSTVVSVTASPETILQVGSRHFRKLRKKSAGASASLGGHKVP